MSLPIVYPTIFNVGDRTRANSGSGTLQRLSRRIAHRAAGADHAAGGRLEKEFRPVGVVNEVVEAGGAGRFALPRLAAPLVGHARRPHLLVVERGQQRDRFDRDAGVGPLQRPRHGRWVVRVEDAAQRLRAVEQPHPPRLQDAHHRSAARPPYLAQLHDWPSPCASESPCQYRNGEAAVAALGDSRQNALPNRARKKEGRTCPPRRNPFASTTSPR